MDEKRKLQQQMDLLTDWVSRYFGPNMLYIAHEIYRTVYEKEKPDMQRDSKYQKRNYNLIFDRVLLADRSFDLETDQAFFRKSIINLHNYSREDLPDALQKLLSRVGDTVSAEDISNLYRRSSLLDPESRKRLAE